MVINVQDSSQGTVDNTADTEVCSDQMLPVAGAQLDGAGEGQGAAREYKRDHCGGATVRAGRAQRHGEVHAAPAHRATAGTIIG